MTYLGKNTYCKEITVNGTITWDPDAVGGGFNPPLADSGINTLSATLSAGNDATQQKILNAGGLSFSLDGISRTPPDGHITGATEINTNVLRATESHIVRSNCIDIDFDENASGTTIKGSTVENDKTVCTHLDLSDPSNFLGNRAGNLAETLILGNSSGASDINMNGNLISNAISVGAETVFTNIVSFSDVAGTSLSGRTGATTPCYRLDLSNSSNTFPNPTDNLADVCSRNNTMPAATVLNMNSNAITNATSGTFSAQLTTRDLAVQQPVFPAGTPGAGSSLTINATAPANTGTLSLQSSYAVDAGIFPTRIVGDSSYRTDGVSRTCTRCTFLDLSDSTNIIPGSSHSTLTDVLNQGNSAGSTSINLNYQDILNGTEINSIGLLAQSNSSPTPDNIGGLVLIKNTNGATTSKLKFEGVSGSNTFDTEIIGDSTLNDATPAAVKYTKCSYLDLRDSTNRFTPSSQEAFEWGSSWIQPTTTFPPPSDFGGTYPNGGTIQIPLKSQVYFDFNEDDFPGWRYFAAMSDGACQLDEDDELQYPAGHYIYPSDPWTRAFHGITFSTTETTHSSQIVKFTFPVVFKGFGRIYMGLAYNVMDDVLNPEPSIIEDSFRLIEENDSQVISDNHKINGFKTTTWYLKNTFPTDGTKWRVYPVCRTDDAIKNGHLIIRIADAQPLDSCNSDPPDFTPSNTNAQHGQLILTGAPLPATWLDFAPPV